MLALLSSRGQTLLHLSTISVRLQRWIVHLHFSPRPRLGQGGRRLSWPEVSPFPARPFRPAGRQDGHLLEGVPPHDGADLKGSQIGAREAAAKAQLYSSSWREKKQAWGTKNTLGWELLANVPLKLSKATTAMQHISHPRKNSQQVWPMGMKSW